MTDTIGKDRLMVEKDGENITVFNHVSLSTHHYINSVNGYESFDPDISMGDMGGGPEPDAVTERLAEYLYDEFYIDVEDHDIEVIDVDSDDVTIL